MELTLNDTPITVDPIAAQEIVRRHLLEDKEYDRDVAEWRKEFEAWKAARDGTGAKALACVAQNGMLPQLKEGEVLIGSYMGPDFKTTAAILLPGVKKKVNWTDAGAWAKAQGGDLPSRIEGLLLFTYHRALFDKGDVLWLNEQYAFHDDCAWTQSFSYGSQNYWHKDSKGMARAVRRVTL